MEREFVIISGLVVAAIVIAGALGFYFATITVVANGSGPQSPTTTQSSVTQSSAVSTTNNSGAYKLTIVEVMMTPWNMTIMQPKFYVLGSHGLESTANISLPAHKLIQLTIFSYDTPTPNVSAQWANVTGTLGGTMAFYNGTLASGIDNETMEQMMSVGMNVTSVSIDTVAHTFTVPGLGINVPVVGGSTEMAYLYFNQAGTFTWMCMTPCGLGPNSSGGAMSTAGWMTGTLTVT